MIGCKQVQGYAAIIFNSSVFHCKGYCDHDGEPMGGGSFCALYQLHILFHIYFSVSMVFKGCLDDACLHQYGIDQQLVNDLSLEESKAVLKLQQTCLDLSQVSDIVVLILIDNVLHVFETDLYRGFAHNSAIDKIAPGCPILRSYTNSDIQKRHNSLLARLNSIREKRCGATGPKRGITGQMLQNYV